MMRILFAFVMSCALTPFAVAQIDVPAIDLQIGGAGTRPDCWVLLGYSSCRMVLKRDYDEDEDRYCSTCQESIVFDPFSGDSFMVPGECTNWDEGELDVYEESLDIYVNWLMATDAESGYKEGPLQHVECGYNATCLPTCFVSSTGNVECGHGMGWDLSLLSHALQFDKPCQNDE